jgi:LmbE family N-acetylglucosaminyl deacetylase
VATAEPEPLGGPWLEISAGELSLRHYLEPGTRGATWLNVSGLSGHAAPGTVVSVRGHGATVSAAAAPVRLFASGVDLSGRILVLAPHPDDAELAAFGVYAERASTIVTVTVGNAGAMNYEAVLRDPAEHYTFKGRIRLIDSITVPWQGGIRPESCFNLGYFDARVEEMYRKPGRPVPEMFAPNIDTLPYRRLNLGTLLPIASRSATWGNLVEDLEQVLRKVEPTVVVSPHPQLDTHSDHQFTTVALAQALERWGRPVTLLLYTNHATAPDYPAGPAGTPMSLPPHEGPVSLDRVYSYPLSASVQTTKLFAVESMHDVRLSPSRQYQLVIGTDRTVHPEPSGPAPDLAYLRRGVRSNELFFVYDNATFAAVVREFLH